MERYIINIAGERIEAFIILKMDLSHGRVNQDADDEIIGFDPDIKIKRGYVYMPYTVPRDKLDFQKRF